MGDPENKRKRYCLMCNVFKPDRCHHCSACNRCVLNMDHHCPWVNNCIGFYNRKYFLLLLYYGVGTLVFFILIMTLNFVETILWYISIYKHPDELSVSKLIIMLTMDAMFFFVIFLIVVLVRFTIFHIELVDKNTTTLENLEHKGNDYESSVSNYMILV